MSWQPQNVRPAANYHAGAPPAYGASAHNKPAQLKRQASELKSMYPLTRWCACYVNTQASNSNTSQDWAELDVTSSIPPTNIYVPMDLEKEIISQIEGYLDEEKEMQQQMAQQKQEIESNKGKQRAEEDDKIGTLMSITSMTDKQKARQLLEANGWDLQKAAAQQFSSSPDVAQGPSEGYSNGGQALKSVLRLILPDNRQFTYQMDSNDTFWGVYGRLLQSVPELNQKAFTFELPDGHTLDEAEFDQTLSQAHLVPSGEIRIKY